MTWPDSIAAVLGLIALALIVHHQHRSSTAPPSRNPQDGEQRT